MKAEERVATVPEGATVRRALLRESATARSKPPLPLLPAHATPRGA